MSHDVQVKMRQPTQATPSMPAAPASQPPSETQPTQQQPLTHSSATAFFERHSSELIYAAIGLVTAVLILSIGILPTLLIALLAAIGMLIGRYRDGDAALRGLLRSAAARRGK